MTDTALRTSLVVLATFVVAACRGGDAAKPVEVELGANGSGSAEVVALPRTGPHSGAIERIAVTDDGRVAYTIDTFGEARLWLALDGSREPIIVRGGRATRVALGRTDEGFVAALLDQANGLALARFDREGRARGHASLPPEPGFLDVVAVGGGVLARRRDEVLVLYDATGRQRGQIAVEPGERIASVATRRGRVIAALRRGDAPGIALRWVVVDRGLRWGDRQGLRGTVEAPIALSPDGTKIAAIDGATSRFEIVNLTTGDGMYAMSADSTIVSDAPVLGFLDDNTAVFSDARGTVWWALALQDPWATSRRGAPSETSDIAVGDHVMLDSSSTSLTLTTEVSMKYLGYRDVGPSVLWSTAAGVATQRVTRSVWLDRDLRERVTHVSPSAQVSVIAGEHHLVISDPGRIYAYDVRTQEEKAIGSYVEPTGVSYDAATRVILVIRRRAVERFQLDTAPFAITRLSSLAMESDFGQVTLLDPRTADGVIAAVATHDGGVVRLDWYRDAPETDAVKRAGSSLVRGSSMPLGADQRGVVYFFDRAAQKLVRYQFDQPVRELPLPVTELATAAVHPDGTLVVVATATEIAAFDTTSGAERWRLAVPGIDTLKISTDGQTLFASARGGMVSIDPRHGARLATACGWSFGLHDDPVSAQVFSVPNLCAGLE